MTRFYLFVIIAFIYCIPAWSTNKPQKAIYSLIERITPGYSSQYQLEIIPSDTGNDVYEIDSNGQKIILRGNNAVSLASAFHWYLKYTCKAHISWFGNQLNLPEQLPKPIKKERKNINGKYRVYMNYCTISYTAAWWDWERWQYELDFMAMNGINTPLFTIGLDGVWYNTLLRFGFNDIEARTFLTSPGHSAWQWMQNIQSYGGPLPKSIIDKHIVLGKKIVERLLELDMKPIQQGFSGYVPRELQTKFPNAHIQMKKKWCGFKGTAQLDPTDPLFHQIGLAFLEEQDKLFGSYGLYAADPFHESAPPIDTPEYLHNVGQTIHQLFQSFDPNGLWVMQAWSLREEIVKAVPRQKLLILDLNGAKTAQNKGYWGYPVVMGNLHNFGGRINMHGDLALLSSNQYKKAKEQYSNVCGSGLFMEAIEQNPVYYDLAFEIPNHTDTIPLSSWLAAYAERRYGSKSIAAEKAWLYMLEGPYKKGTNGTERSSIIAARPALTVKKSGPNAGLGIPYEPTLLIKAEDLLLKDANKLAGSKPYRFDIVDVQRQIMTNLGQVIHKCAADAFRAKDKAAFTLHSSRFLTLLEDMDQLLYTRPEYSFDCWLTKARSWGDTEFEKDLMEQDATSLVTIWGSDGDPVIFDYSWREWAGLIKGYYLPRWEKFYAMLQTHLNAGTNYEEDNLPLTHGRESFRANEFYSQLGEWELNYVRKTGKARTPIAQGDELIITRQLFDKYSKLAHEYYAESSDTNFLKEEHTFENLGED